MQKDSNNVSFEEVFERLTDPYDKVRLILKYASNPVFFYCEVIPIVGTKLATNLELLDSMGKAYLDMREDIINQTDECWRKQLDFFKTLIDFHQKSKEEKSGLD